jgi:hypothetical protein
MTPTEIETLTRKELREGPFPYKDARRLKANHGANDDIVPDLSTYFSIIVGLASTATRLNKRAPQQLRTYGPRLRYTFFQLFPQHEIWRQGMNAQNTPQLNHEMQVAERVRIALLPIIDDLLQSAGEISE